MTATLDGVYDRCRGEHAGEADQFVWDEAQMTRATEQEPSEQADRPHERCADRRFGAQWRGHTS